MIHMLAQGQGSGFIGSLFGSIFGCSLGLLWLAIVVFSIVGMWKVYTKAGKPGWASLVPIYNFVVLLEIVGKPLWWIILFLIPIANVVVTILVMLELAKKFHQTPAFAIGLLLLPMIFMCILGYGSATYDPSA